MISTPLPALPLRQIATSLTDDDLDRLDMFRRTQEDMPARAAVLREALRLYLDLQESPLLVMGAILDGLAAIHGVDAVDEDCIGASTGAER